MARSRTPKKVPNFKTLTGEVRRGLKVGTFFCSLSRVAIERLQESPEQRANAALLETVGATSNDFLGIVDCIDAHDSTPSGCVVLEGAINEPPKHAGWVGGWLGG
jgi:hypothetical protein